MNGEASHTDGDVPGSAQRYRDLLRIGVELTGERDHHRLLERILRRGIDIAKADGGILYVWNDEGLLIPAHLHYPLVGLAAGSAAAQSMCEALQAISPKVIETGRAENDWIPGRVAKGGGTVVADTLHDIPDADTTDMLAFDQENLFETGPVAAIPLTVRAGKVAGVLHLVRGQAEGQPATAAPFAAATVDYLELFAAQAAGNLHNLHLFNHAVTADSELMGEMNPQELLERIIQEAKTLSDADGAILFLRTDDDLLRFTAIQIDSKDIRAFGGGEALAYPALQLYDAETGDPNGTTFATLSALEQRTVNIDDLDHETPADNAVARVLDENFAYRARSVLAVPLVDRKRSTIGVLYLMNARDGASGDIVAFGSQVTALIEALSAQASEALDNQAVHRQLVETGISLSAELDHDLLMEKILLEAKEICNAEGGTLYLMNDDNKSLAFTMVHNDFLNIAMGGKTGAPITFPPLQLFDEDGKPNHHAVATHVALSGEPVNIPDAYDTEEFDFSGARNFDAKTGYRSKSFLTVPLKDRENEVIGVLQLINARDWVDNDIIAFSDLVQPLVESLASQAAVALNNQQLIQAQRDLLVAFIQLIAGAIDAKSPYTGGHCQRVPELTMMLCEAAATAETGSFVGFALNEEQLYELHIAALLHDCGKVTTPEYVVDKATKLETIYNRIHEVRTRFELVKREAEIDYYKALAEGSGDAAALKAELDATLAALDDEYAFIAEINIGGEFMDDGKIERLSGITARTFTRMLSNRVGLSHWEEKLIKSLPPESLPAVENLLADRPEHIMPRENTDLGPMMDQYGFKMDVPDSVTNLGEVYNLGIRRGTLTEEERFKINDHIVQTIVMLELLPFPRGLRRVPEYAGGHHEKMDGTGYPRRLNRDEMSIPARIMAIADIFEALTASDRPYKKAKTLSEAVRIMSFMVKDQHIDSELFELFLRTNIHKSYGDMFLKPEQIDDVDIGPYLNDLS